VLHFHLYINIEGKYIMNKTTTTLLPAYTPKQEQLIIYLYQFRFLNTHQFQKLFNHKDPHRIKQWLKDLTTKGYLQSDYKKMYFHINQLSTH
jgi:hypothetical protein